MKKTIATIAATFAAILITIGAGGIAHAAPARHRKPTPAQVQAYLCAVTPNSNSTEVCQHIPGPWNDFAGRTTPARWDPCDGTATLVHQLPCGPMSPTIPQWCTLHFDHHVAGWNLCRSPQPWT